MRAGAKGKREEAWQLAINTCGEGSCGLASINAMKHPAGWMPVIFLPVWHLQNLIGIQAED